MSTFTRPPLDFTVVREDWCRYDLTDNNTILKVKTILTKIFKNQSNYSVDFHNIYVVLTHERGEPDIQSYSSQELQKSITHDDIRFATVSQDWNEYVADDGTRVKIQPIVSRVAKTSKFNNKGEPIYWVDMQATVQVRPPTPSA